MPTPQYWDTPSMPSMAALKCRTPFSTVEIGMLLPAGLEYENVPPIGITTMPPTVVKSAIKGSPGAMSLNWQPGRGGIPLPPTPPVPTTPAAPVMGPTDPPAPVGGGPRPPNEPPTPEVPPNPPPPVKPPMPITLPTVTSAPTQRGTMPLGAQTNCPARNPLHDSEAQSPLFW